MQFERFGSHPTMKSRKLKKIRNVFGAKDKSYQISYSFSILSVKIFHCDNIPIQVFEAAAVVIYRDYADETKDLHEKFRYIYPYPIPYFT